MQTDHQNLTGSTIQVQTRVLWRSRRSEQPPWASPGSTEEGTVEPTEEEGLAGEVRGQHGQDPEESMSVECLGTTSRDTVQSGTGDEDQDLGVQGRAGPARRFLLTACLPDHSSTP